MARHDDVPATWRERATDVPARRLSCGHCLAEEVPEETLEALTSFLGG
jgi:haloacetate dehalogenase